jgi:hypothetical protein
MPRSSCCIRHLACVGGVGGERRGGGGSGGWEGLGLGVGASEDGASAVKEGGRGSMV